jgi:hypothetical protein
LLIFRSDLMVKKLRYYARFIVVCLLLKKMKLVRDLVMVCNVQTSLSFLLWVGCCYVLIHWLIDLPGCLLHV